MSLTQDHLKEEEALPTHSLQSRPPHRLECLSFVTQSLFGTLVPDRTVQDRTDEAAEDRPLEEPTLSAAVAVGNISSLT